MVLDVLVVARWIHFAAVFTLFGAPLFPAYAGDGFADTLAMLPRTGRDLQRLVLGAAVIGVVAGLIWLWASLAMIAGDFAAALAPDLVRPFLFATPFGPFELARVGLFVLLLAAAVAPARLTLGLPIVAALAACLLASQAWLGHAAEGGDTWRGLAMIASYAVHVLGAAAWIGGLPPLLLALGELAERRAAGGPGRDTLVVLGRYSNMAVFAVGAVVISGAANTYFRTGLDFAALLRSPWGHVLGVKLLLVACAFGLAARNRFVAMPRLDGENPHGRRIAGRLRVSIGVELALGILVFGAAALLGVTPPPAQP